MCRLFKVGSLNNDINAFKFLARLQSDVLSCEEKDIILDFEECGFSHAVFTSFLGAMTNICQQHGKTIRYRFDTGSKTYKYFKKSGLYDYLTNDGKNGNINQNALPFWQVEMDEQKLMNYIDAIIDLSRIRVIDTARQVLFKNFYEIFVNAKDHSEEQYGVFSCGHWMPNMKCLVFSLYDTGIGISQLVKNKVDPDMSDEEALEWAMISGNSTRQLEFGVPRGLGLSDLKNFVKINNGRLTILSKGIYYDFDRNKLSRVEKFDYENIGTLVCVTIDQDREHIYVK